MNAITHFVHIYPSTHTNNYSSVTLNFQTKTIITTNAHTKAKIIPAQTPNSMRRNTWAEKLHASLLSNCTLRYLVLMAVAHMTCYQHFVSKTSMANAVRSKSGPGALCVGPQRSLSRPRRSLCRGPAARRSLFGATALPGRSLSGSVSGPGPRRSLSGSVSGPGGPLDALCVGPRRSLCRGPALGALRIGVPHFVSGRDRAPLLSHCLCWQLRSGPSKLRSAATYPVLWVLLACQPVHHVILKHCFALVIASTCSHSPGMLTQILEIYWTIPSRNVSTNCCLYAYISGCKPLYFFGRGFCAVCLLGPQKQTMPSRMIRVLTCFNPLTSRRSHASKAHQPLSWDLQFSRSVMLSSELSNE